MPAHWIRFNEYDDVLASTDLLAMVASGLKKRPSNWKWMILAAHNGVQGALVCSIQDTSGTNILSKTSATAMLDWLETLEGHKPQEHLADFHALLKKYRTMYPSPGITVQELKHLRKLHNEFRNNFMHFVPKHWVIEIAGLPSIIGSALNLIEEAMQQHQVMIHLNGNMTRRLKENLSIARAELAAIKIT